MEGDDEIKRLREKWPNVVIVDNDIDGDLETFALYLKKAPCNVHKAGGSEEALAIAAEIGVNIFLIDINLAKGESGLALAEKLKFLYPDALVCLMTGEIETAYCHRNKDIRCIDKESREKTAQMLMAYWNQQNLSNDLKRKLSKIEKKLPYMKMIRDLTTGEVDGLEYLDGRLVGYYGFLGYIWWLIKRFLGRIRPPQWIRWVIYRYPEHPGMIDIGIAPTVGCIGKCRSCASRNRPFERKLLYTEMLAQVMHTLWSFISFGFLYDEYKISVNLTCEGESTFNMENVYKFVKKLFQVKELPIVKYIITTIGNARVLEEYLEKFALLPVWFYWSVHSLYKEKREWLLPATKGHSLEKIRKVFMKFYKLTGRKTTFCWMLVKGFNDSEEDIRMIVEFCKDWPCFDIKIMPVADGSLPEYPDIVSEEYVKDFVRRLNAALGPDENGQDRVRYRFAMGLSMKASCGNTTTNAPKNKK